MGKFVADDAVVVRQLYVIFIKYFRHHSSLPDFFLAMATAGFVYYTIVLVDKALNSDHSLFI